MNTVQDKLTQLPKPDARIRVGQEWARADVYRADDVRQIAATADEFEAYVVLNGAGNTVLSPCVRDMLDIRPFATKRKESVWARPYRYKDGSTTYLREWESFAPARA